MRKCFTLLLVCVAAAAARADDTVDLEITARERVEGTLRPTDERENFLIAGLRGAKVKVTAKSREDDGAIPAIVLVDAEGSIVGTQTPTADGGKILVDALAATEGHRVRVTAASGDGDYRLDLEMKPQLRWSGASTSDLATNDFGTFSFAAPAGCVVSIDLRAPRGSAMLPLLFDLTGPAGLEKVFDPPQLGATRHVVRKIPLAEAGEHTVRFRNLGAAAGPWTILVTLVAHRAARTTVDITDATLGGDGTQSVFGRFVSATTPTLLDPDALLSSSTLDGTSILIPAGALAFPTAVTITESDEFLAGDDMHTASSTVRFEPSGLSFAVPASVTIPYDPDAFDDVRSEISIVVQSEDGSQETIPATSVDTGAATATFPATHFSRFQAISPRARPLRGRFVEFEAGGRVGPGHGAAFTVARNEVTVGKGPRAAGPLTRNLARISAGFGLDPQSMPRISASSDTRTANGTAEIVDDATVVLRNPLTDVTLRRGLLPDVLTGVDVMDDEVRFHALLRRSLVPPTRGNLAGRWHAVALTLRATDSEPGTIAVRVASDEFELDIARSGKALASEPRHHQVSQTFPTSLWKPGETSKSPRNVRLEPQGDDARLTITLPGDPGESQVMLASVLRGDALIGVAGASAGEPGALTGAEVGFFLLVRGGTAERHAELPLRALLHGFTLFTEPFPPYPPANLAFSVTDGSYDSRERPPLFFTDFSVQHDIAGAPVSHISDLFDSRPVSVSNDGRGPGGLLLSPRRGVLVQYFPFHPASLPLDRFPLGIALPTSLR